MKGLVDLPSTGIAIEPFFDRNTTAMAVFENAALRLQKQFM